MLGYFSCETQMLYKSNKEELLNLSYKSDALKIITPHLQLLWSLICTNGQLRQKKIDN